MNRGSILGHGVRWNHVVVRGCDHPGRDCVVEQHRPVRSGHRRANVHGVTLWAVGAHHRVACLHQLCFGKAFRMERVGRLLGQKAVVSQSPAIWKSALLCGRDTAPFAENGTWWSVCTPCGRRPRVGDASFGRTLQQGTALILCARSTGGKRTGFRFRGAKLRRHGLGVVKQSQTRSNGKQQASLATLAHHCRPAHL